jgi:hypothetical protein
MTKLTRFTVTDAIVSEMEIDGNPAVRRAAVSLRPMVERHVHGDFSRALDMQAIDQANFSLPVDYRYELVYHE